MKNRLEDILGWIVAVVLVLLILFAVATVKYNCCMDAGYNHQQCLYEIGFGN